MARFPKARNHPQRNHRCDRSENTSPTNDAFELLPLSQINVGEKVAISLKPQIQHRLAVT
jgi:hypothetical protein